MTELERLRKEVTDRMIRRHHQTQAFVQAGLILLIGLMVFVGIVGTVIAIGASQ
jgi:hypothetical protein